MAIISKSGQAVGPAPLDAGGAQGRNDPTQRRRSGMDAFTKFDFSEEALLRGDGFAPHPEGRSPRRDEEERSGDRKKPDPDARVVLAAIAGPQAAPLASPPEETKRLSLDVSGAGRVDAILNRVEQALRASLHSLGQAPLEISVRLDDLHAFGLHSLQVAMTADRLDVTLARAGGPQDPALLAAAQSLAQQLAVRFPTRVVRVLDLDPDRRESEAGQRSALSALGAILATRGQGT